MITTDLDPYDVDSFESIGGQLQVLAAGQRRIEASLKIPHEPHGSVPFAELCRTQQAIATDVAEIRAQLATLSHRVTTGKLVSSVKDVESRSAPSEDSESITRCANWDEPAADSQMVSRLRRSGRVSHMTNTTISHSSEMVDMHEMVSEYFHHKSTINTSTMLAEPVADTWPGDLQVRDFLHVASSRSIAFMTPVCLDSMIDWDMHSGESHWWPVLNPLAPSLVVLDVVSIIHLLFDLTLIPWMLAWEIPVEGVLLYFSVFTCLFWTLDIFMNFSRGIQFDGELEMRPKRVIAHYLRTWFLMDSSIVFCDWISLVFILAFDGPTQSLKLVRFAKLGRILRVAGFFRMIRVAKATDELLERYVSDEVKILCKTISIFIGILWVTHIITCSWYAIGFFGQSDTGGRWLESTTVFGADVIEYKSLSDVYQYATAFHWSIAQITLGAINVDPSNTVERLFNIALLLFGLFFSSTLVSSLCAAITNVQMQMADKNTKLWILRQYLSQNDVDSSLMIRVNKQAKHRFKRKEKLIEKDVEALQILSGSLLAELHFSISRRHVIKHPLFRAWYNMNRHATQELCHNAVVFRYPHAGDDVFLVGTPGNEAYYVIEGQVTYVQDPSSSVVEEFTSTDVDAGKWLAEASLWVQWIHVGTTVAKTSGTILAIDAKAMISACQKYRIVEDLTRAYGTHFHRLIISAEDPNWPNDLEVPFTDFGEMVMSMNADLQIALGLDALKQLRLEAQTHFFARGQSPLDALEQDVELGKSTVYMTGNGEIERVASVIAFRIERDDQRVFVQLGKMEEGRLVADCALPGKKQIGGELPLKSATRIAMCLTRVHSHMNCMSSHVFVVLTEVLGCTSTCLALVPSVFDAFCVMCLKSVVQVQFMLKHCSRYFGHLCGRWAHCKTRILRSKLAPLDGRVHIKSMQREVLWKTRKDIGIRTKYLRTVCHSRFKETPVSSGKASPKTSKVASMSRPRGDKEWQSLSSTVRFGTLPANAQELVDGGSATIVDVRTAIHAFDTEDKLILYSWLTNDQFEHLGTAEGHEFLQRWLDVLDLDEVDTWKDPEDVPYNADHETGTFP